MANNLGLRTARAFVARGRTATALYLLVRAIALALWDQDAIAPLPTVREGAR